MHPRTVIAKLYENGFVDQGLLEEYELICEDFGLPTPADDPRVEPGTDSGNEPVVSAPPRAEAIGI